MVGQAAVFHLDPPGRLQHGLRPGDDRDLGKRQERSKSSSKRFDERNLTHIYVDWKEIQRHRQPGGYGFTDFVKRSRFAEWVAARRARSARSTFTIAPGGMIIPGLSPIKSSTESNSFQIDEYDRFYIV